MQYVLTKEEMDGFAPVREVKDRDEALAVAHALILSGSAFVCIHERPADEKGRRWGNYCDDCPISRGVTYRASQLICTKNRNYSK